MEQFEQLLTCAICLDRYRNPKLLPCQHSFCMEPCMDGLVDYVRRQVKCPECRAEHRIPYQGVQGYPTNVTLQRFLELHIEITGELPDPTSGQIMERCNVCSEKAYCSACVHCDKKICGDCKGAHMDILRREISRINNQIRRALHRLQDALALVEKNQCSLLQNCSAVSEEVDEIYRRLNKALKDRTEYLRGEIDRYLSVEQRNLCTLKENLEQEISNIQSNCDLADKHMTENVEWDDCELMDAKEIFLKTVEFIRNFEYENADYARRVRFTMAHDPNQLVLHVAGYGELTINMPHQHGVGPGGGVVGSASTGGLLAPPGGGPGLMRSKSDHRLASQFRQQEEEAQPARRGYGRRGGGGAGDGADDYRGEFESPYDNEGGRAGRRYRSRFTSRHLGGAGDGDSDTDAQTGRSVRFSGDADRAHHKERERVLDTEDVSRGPLSGITRLYDSPRVMKRLQESENRGKKKEAPAAAPAPAPAPAPKAPAGQAAAKRAPAARQVSEDDEIARIKKQNKATASSSDAVTDAPATPARPQAERVAALKQGRTASSGGSGGDSAEERDSQPSSPTRRTPPGPEGGSSDAESDDGSPVSALGQRKASATGAKGSRRSSTASDATPAAAAHKKAARSGSSDSTTSSESSGASSSRNAATAASSATSTPRTRANDASATTTTATTAPAKPFQSRFLGANRTAASTEKPKDDDEESESESSSESEETESEDESDDASKKKPDPPPMEKSDIGPLLARSQNARDTTEARRRDSRDDTSTGYTPKRYGQTSDDSPTRSSGYQSRYGAAKEDTSPASKYLSGRTRASQQEDEPSSRYGSSGYTSRFLNKSKSSAALSPEEDSDRPKYGSARSASSTASAAADADDSSRYPSGRSRYAALKDRRQRLARSRSSHNFGGGDDDDQDDSPSSPTSTIPSSYLPSRYGPGSSSSSAGGAGAGAGSASSELSRSRSTHALKSRENSPERGAGAAGAGAGEKDGAALSSWARYLKNKYGNRGKDGKDGPSGSAAGSAAASANAARRLSLGLPLRHNSASVESSDDDQKNPAGSPTSPTAATAAAAAAAGFAVAAAGSSPRSQYLQKRRQQFKVGSRGSEPGCFTWPRGIAVGPDNSIVVADSSNHRVQVFDSNGIFVKEFGTYGNGEGEFDCLAGVAVNRIGQFIIADRYNHRIQVMDPSGRFLRAFGSQGTADGRFNYPWGITTDALGFIYVCDKENHRVQVFQSDGTFVGKFGSCGSKPGQLEHPHYIAVSNTNRVIVSDSNNHRVQIFDVNGKVLTTFGTEGSDEGQFKFPRQIKKSKSSHRALGLPVKLSRSKSFKMSAPSNSTKSLKQPTISPVSHSLSPASEPPRSLSPRARRVRSHAARIASKAVNAAEGSSSRRSRLHLCGRLGEQPNTDLPSGWDLPSSFRMLGVRRRGVQGPGGNSSDVQWQHSSLRQGKSQNTSILTSHPGVKPLPIRKSVHTLRNPEFSTSGSYQSNFNVPVAMPAMKTIVANTIQVNKRRPSLTLSSPPLLPPIMRYQR